MLCRKFALRLLREPSRCIIVEILTQHAHGGRAEASPQPSPARRSLVERVRSLSNGAVALPPPGQPEAAVPPAAAAGASTSPGAAGSEPNPSGTNGSSRSSRPPSQQDEAAELARMRRQLERQLNDIASRQAELAQLGFGDAGAPAGGTHRREPSITGPQLLRPTAFGPGTASAEAAQLGPASGRLSGRVHRRSHSAESVLMPGGRNSTSSIAAFTQSSISPAQRLSPPPDTERNVEVDDGVWLTFERSGGRNKIKRIRFSQQRFPSEASWQAWWQVSVALRLVNTEH